MEVENPRLLAPMTPMPCTFSQTEDTFAVVADHVGGRGINFRRGNLAVIISLIVHAQLMGQLLELAVSAADTGQAGTVVVG